MILKWAKPYKKTDWVAKRVGKTIEIRKTCPPCGYSSANLLVIVKEGAITFSSNNKATLSLGGFRDLNEAVTEALIAITTGVPVICD
jgi:hypothetical protein